MTRDRFALGRRLDAACHAGIELVFVGAESRSEERLSAAQLWDEARTFAEAHGERLGERVAVVLDNSRASVQLLLGLAAAGVGVVSLPLPHRAQPVDDYVRFCDRMRATAGCSTIVVPDELGAAARGYGLAGARGVSSILAGTARPLDAAGAGPGGAGPADAELDMVQFSSGTTATAKGICFGWADIIANVDAILGWLSPSDDDVGLFWLPLSHDMGLVGGLLSSLLSGDRVERGRFVLLRPEAFGRDPATWFAACAHFGATITAGPDFGYRLAARVGHATGSLSRLRACIVGSEPVRLATLLALHQALAPSGWRLRSYCPAYGLAEAGLAVTACPVEATPLAVIGDGDPAPVDELVGCDHPSDALLCSGAPLPGFEVRIDGGGGEGGGGEGPIGIRGPSLARRSLTTELPRSADGYLRTGDIGWLSAGGLVVSGRHDDTIVLGGRNVFAPQVEATVAHELGLRPGKVAITVDPEGVLVVLVESDDTIGLQEVRGAVRATAGVSPAHVVRLARGTMPRTPSGKLRRRELGRLVSAGEATGEGT